MQGRREKRNSAKLQVLVSNLERPWVSELVSMENINSYGMCVLAERPWEPGAIVLIKSSRDELRARARVVYCKPVKHKTFGLGLEFLAGAGANIKK